MRDLISNRPDSVMQTLLRIARRLVSRKNVTWRGRIAPSADIRHANISVENTYFIGENSKISGRLSLGNGSTIGRSNHIFGDVTIGRYCQLAPCVGIYATNHPITHASTYVNSRLFAGRLKQWQEDNRVVIGNDVWIGHGAVILAGVTIGNGSIIGAGAVVTKPVPDFTVAVGNPARIARERFPLNVSSALAELAWWNLSEDQLAELEELFHIDLARDPEEGLRCISVFLARHPKSQSVSEGASHRKPAPAYDVVVPQGRTGSSVAV